MNYKVLIPARLGSTRLPGKPLKEIEGKTLIQRVVDQVKESKADSIHVATDSQEIIEHCNLNGIKAVLTSINHQTGSDRLAETCDVLQFMDDDIVINVQGDEPFIDPKDIDNLASLAAEKNANMVTLYSDLKENDLNDKNVVKIWIGSNSLVEDFSREGHKLDIRRAKKHLGIYGYKASFLRSFVSWQQTHNEIERNLEQMRAMDNGEMIFATESVGKYHLGVDNEIDLKRAIEIAKQIK